MKNFFKKRSVLITAGILCISIFLAGCSDKKEQGQENLTPVTLSEVAHSIFYAPQYAAYELGYFKDEGIDLTIENAFGADKVMTAHIRKCGYWIRRFRIFHLCICTRTGRLCRKLCPTDTTGRKFSCIPHSY